MASDFTAVLERFKTQGHPELQTLGKLTLYDEWNCALAVVKTLELPDKGNKQNVSQIPEGDYVVELRYSKKFKWHFHITDVHGRSYILIHSGNYYTEIRGCVLVGKDFIDINGDGVLDVTDSRKTLNKLLDKAPSGFNLTIKQL